MLIVELVLLLIGAVASVSDVARQAGLNIRSWLPLGLGESIYLTTVATSGLYVAYETFQGPADAVVLSQVKHQRNRREPPSTPTSSNYVPEVSSVVSSAEVDEPEPTFFPAVETASVLQSTISDDTERENAQDENYSFDGPKDEEEGYIFVGSSYDKWREWMRWYIMSKYFAAKHRIAASLENTARESTYRQLEEGTSSDARVSADSDSATVPFDPQSVFSGVGVCPAPFGSPDPENPELSGSALGGILGIPSENWEGFALNGAASFIVTSSLYFSLRTAFRSSPDEDDFLSENEAEEDNTSYGPGLISASEGITAEDSRMPTEEPQSTSAVDDASEYDSDVTVTPELANISVRSDEHPLWAVTSRDAEPDDPIQLPTGYARSLNDSIWAGDCTDNVEEETFKYPGATDTAESDHFIQLSTESGRSLNDSIWAGDRADDNPDNSLECSGPAGTAEPVNSLAVPAESGRNDSIRAGDGAGEPQGEPLKRPSLTASQSAPRHSSFILLSPTPGRSSKDSMWAHRGDSAEGPPLHSTKGSGPADSNDAPRPSFRRNKSSRRWAKPKTGDSSKASNGKSGSLSAGKPASVLGSASQPAGDYSGSSNTGKSTGGTASTDQLPKKPPANDSEKAKGQPKNDARKPRQRAAKQEPKSMPRQAPEERKSTRQTKSEGNRAAEIPQVPASGTPKPQQKGDDSKSNFQSNAAEAPRTLSSVALATHAYQPLGSSGIPPEISSWASQYADYLTDEAGNVKPELISGLGSAGRAA
ncbi:hypothetical protein GLOTRDRAFT_132344 [Gloeophyllum trabeum ATCC 11539]|uniref:Uncharacterized protein n=1 Tax=Gloeophyllum trabeum (strain ATCC 11539 / FP-39264 / Madison 617) TaxID=670483 RepID=S7RDD0_GLOTA|nr:uncharacterized protein GLOTRDRAFT_132344 [Gloeophyllum trabeum ATCC 11539]EPQ52225.1 hypothetical protein GLOTRDRAFT_132344 [Gloeophyllum trabeum ATCC 11539]